MVNRAQADAIIVGGGIAGASVAFFLQSSGFGKVLLLERDAPGSGATGRSVALLRVHYANKPEAQLAYESLKIYQNWEDIVGGYCGYKRTGFLWLVSPQEMDKLHHNTAMIGSLGHRIEILDAGSLKEVQPHLNVEDIGGAAYEPDGGYGDPSDATYYLITRARDLGAEVRTGAPVRRILVEHGRVTGVEVDSSTISAPVVVLAAGGWSAKLAETAGIDLPVKPLRITTGSVRYPTEVRAPMTLIDSVADTYFKPDVGDLGIIRVSDAHTRLEIDPDEELEGVLPDALINGALRASHRIPSLERATMARAWSGCDGFTPDNRAIIGAVPEVEGLYVNVGGSGKGFKVAPAIGKALAELICTGVATTVDLTPFRLGRFAEGDTKWSDTEYVGTLLA